MRRTIAITGTALALAMAGCGDEDEVSGPEVVPAAGENTPMRTPGVPSGVSYDLSAAEWLDLDEADRVKAAADFVADTPAACTDAADEPVPAKRVRDYAAITAGTDFPLTAPVAELLAEGCAAELQSGEAVRPGSGS